MLGKSSVLLKSENREEIEWRTVLARIFEGLGLKYNYPIGKYRVDFFVEKLMLVLEYDGNNHNSYDLAEEEEREKVISRHYTLIRFNKKTDLESLCNAILKSQIKEVICLY